MILPYILAPAAAHALDCVTSSGITQNGPLHPHGSRPLLYDRCQARIILAGHRRHESATPSVHFRPIAAINRDLTVTFGPWAMLYPTLHNGATGLFVQIIRSSLRHPPADRTRGAGSGLAPRLDMGG